MFMGFLISLAASLSPLQEASLFLKKNQKLPEVKIVEEGKIQYKVLQKGSGNELKEYHNPVFHFEKQFLHKSIEESSGAFSVKDLPEALQKGLIGMKEGEKRILYIHPDSSGEKELLIWEVELLQVENPHRNVRFLEDLFPKEGVIR